MSVLNFMASHPILVVIFEYFDAASATQGQNPQTRTRTEIVQIANETEKQTDIENEPFSSLLRWNLHQFSTLFKSNSVK